MYVGELGIWDKNIWNMLQVWDSIRVKWDKICMEYAKSMGHCKSGMGQKHMEYAKSMGYCKSGMGQYIYGIC